MVDTRCPKCKGRRVRTKEPVLLPNGHQLRKFYCFHCHETFYKKDPDLLILDPPMSVRVGRKAVVITMASTIEYVKTTGVFVLWTGSTCEGRITKVLMSSLTANMYLQVGSKVSGSNPFWVFTDKRKEFHGVYGGMK